MITFYTTEDCRACAEIREKLKEMCLAHEVIIVEKGARPDIAPLPVTAMPVLIEGKKNVQGLVNVQRYLEDIQNFKSDWDRFQSDACFCGPGGDIE